MGTRNGQSYFWSLINDFLDDDILNREEFIKGAIHRIHDGVVAGRDLVFNLAQQLGSTNAGTSAVQRGTVVMGTIAFYDPIDTPVADLDGLTLILETDLTGPVTVTFAQPVSPAHVATQINTQASALGLVASVDTGVDPNTGAAVAANVGKLLLVRPSGGTASLTVKGAGTANAILGLPLIDTTTTGTGTVNDGASRIGVGAFGSWAGGTLRSFLQSAVLSLSGGTISGPIVLAPGGAIDYQPVVLLPDADTTLTLGSTFYYVLGGHAAPRTYILPDPPREGMVLYIFKSDGAFGPNDAFDVERADATPLADYNGSNAYGWMMFIAKDFGGTIKWVGALSGGDATAYYQP